MQYRRTNVISTALMTGLLLAAVSEPSHSATLEEQAKGLEKSVQTVEQRRKAALKDLKVSVLQGYRDSLQIESVETRVGEVFDRTVRVEVTVAYSFDFEKAKAVRESLRKYYQTSTDKQPGVEPYGRIYVDFPYCVGAYCTVNKEMTHYLQRSAVGVNVTFMGMRGAFVTSDMLGHYELKPGSVTLQFDVPKGKIKGDPKAVATAQVFDVHFCPDDPDCSGRRYTIQK